MDNTRTPRSSQRARTPFIIFTDVTGVIGTSSRPRGVDTSAYADDDTPPAGRDGYPDPYPEGQASIVEIPMDEEGDEPRHEDSPYTRGADFTPLTGMSSEFHNVNSGGPNSEPDDGFPQEKRQTIQTQKV